MNTFQHQDTNIFTYILTLISVALSAVLVVGGMIYGGQQYLEAKLKSELSQLLNFMSQISSANLAHLHFEGNLVLSGTSLDDYQPIKVKSNCAKTEGCFNYNYLISEPSVSNTISNERFSILEGNLISIKLNQENSEKACSKMSALLKINEFRFSDLNEFIDTSAPVGCVSHSNETYLVYKG